MDKERERIRKEIFDKPKEVVQEPPKEDNGTEINPDINPGLLKMFPPERLDRIMKKEARKYKDALKKKWGNWFRAVSK